MPKIIKSFWIYLVLILAVRIIIHLQSQTIYPNHTKVKLSGRLATEPIQYENAQRVMLLGYKFYLPLYPKLSYGDEVVVTGVIEEDKLKSPKLLETKTGGKVYRFRNKILSFYNANLPKDHAALVSGVVLGAKAGIGSELWEKFKKSGTAHVVVASGMNVTLVSGFALSFLLLFFKRRYAIPFALAGIWLYAVISGFDAPIVRACIMGSVAFIAQELGKLNLALRTTFLTAILMLFIMPGWISDLGFWLSFLATLSILKFEKSIEIKLQRITFKEFRQNLATALSAQIGAAPILFYFFGQFNILSPIINVFVLWTIVPMTLIGMISGVLSFISEPIGTFVLYLTYPLTSWFLWVVEIFT